MWGLEIQDSTSHNNLSGIWDKGFAVAFSANCDVCRPLRAHPPPSPTETPPLPPPQHGYRGHNTADHRGRSSPSAVRLKCQRPPITQSSRSPSTDAKAHNQNTAARLQKAILGKASPLELLIILKSLIHFKKMILCGFFRINLGKAIEADLSEQTQTFVERSAIAERSVCFCSWGEREGHKPQTPDSEMDEPRF